MRPVLLRAASSASMSAVNGPWTASPDSPPPPLHICGHSGSCCIEGERGEPKQKDLVRLDDLTRHPPAEASHSFSGTGAAIRPPASL